jgi:predicted small lipoprotein YifL
MVRPIQERDVFEFHRLSRGLAIAVALAAALALAACGRKGDLDPPPGASVTGQPQAQTQSGLLSPVGVTPIGGGQAASGGPSVGPNGEPLAPKGPKKFIPLDVLLN